MSTFKSDRLSKELSEHYRNYQSMSRPNTEHWKSGIREEKAMSRGYSTLADFEELVKNHVEDIEISPEFFDFIKIVEAGAVKHGRNTWLNPDGPKTSEKDMHDSMFHHLAESFSLGRYALINEGTLIQDAESGFDPLLHLACRALMLYTRRRRGIVHQEDKV